MEDKNQLWLDELVWDECGLIPVITQEADSNDVLMFAYMNKDALLQTIRLKQAVYWSRSRQRLWHKGEESGNFQQVHEIRVDCDKDVLLLKVTQMGHKPGVACHTGRHSCFFRVFEEGGSGRGPNCADDGGLAEQGGRWVSVDPVLLDPKTMYGE